MQTSTWVGLEKVCTLCTTFSTTEVQSQNFPGKVLKLVKKILKIEINIPGNIPKCAIAATYIIYVEYFIAFVLLLLTRRQERDLLA